MFFYKKFFLMLCITGALGNPRAISAAQDFQAKIDAPDKTDCCICLENRSNGDCLSFACSHIVCTECYTKPTFNKKLGCPLCKTEIKLASCAQCKNQTTIDDQNILSCGHVFHSRCINRVLMQAHPLCPSPTCKKPIQLYTPTEEDAAAKPIDNSADSKQAPAGSEVHHTPETAAQKRPKKAAFLAKEAGVALLVGMGARAAWQKFIKKEKNSTKRKVAFALIILGMAGSHVALNYAHPNRKDHPELALYSWAGGFCAGLYLADKLSADKLATKETK